MHAIQGKYCIVGQAVSTDLPPPLYRFLIFHSRMSSHICPTCEARFSSAESVRRHRSNKHAGEFALTANGVEHKVAMVGSHCSCPVHSSPQS